MRIVLGVLSLLVALAVVAMLVKQQLRAVGVVDASDPGLAGVAASATPAEQSRALQQQVQQDVERALQQGPARAAAAEQ